MKQALRRGNGTAKILLLCATLSLPALAQKSRVYPLFHPDTLFTENQTVTCDETWVGDNLILLCRNNKDDREMFRLKIGDRHAKYADYGITNQADFNGDGKPDFALYVGNANAAALYLELSFRSGYKRVNVAETAARFWSRTRHHQGKALQAADLEDVRLSRNGSALSLSATVLPTLTRLIIPAADFVWEKQP